MEKNKRKKIVVTTFTLLLSILLIFGIIFWILSVTKKSTSSTTNLSTKQLLAESVFSVVANNPFGSDHTSLADIDPVLLEAIQVGGDNATWETNEETTINKFGVPVRDRYGNVRTVFCIQHGR